MRTPIPSFAIVLLYAVGIAYALVFSVLGNLSVLLMWGTLGGILIWYFFLYFVLKVIIAAVMGYQARWSVLRSLFAGLPLVVLYGVISAIVDSKDSLPTPLPWVSSWSHSQISAELGVKRSVSEALLVWGAFFLIGIALHIRAARADEAGVASVARRRRRNAPGFPDTVPMRFDQSQKPLSESILPSSGATDTVAFDVGPEVVLRDWGVRVWRAYLAALQRYDEYTGVSSRFDYWSFIMVSELIGSLLFFLRHDLSMALLRLGAPTFLSTAGPLLLPFLYGLLTWWPTVSVTVRRLQDSGRSGRWILIGVIPVVGWVWLLYLLLQPSERLRQV